jgi:hypothetical protein
MPMDYTIDPEASGVRLRCWGILTNEEMLDCVRRMHSDPARQPGTPSLVDCREIQEMRVTPDGMHAAVCLEQVLADPAQEPWSIAVIAPQDDVFWMGRLYEVLRAGSPSTVRIFRNAVDAEAWLQRQTVGSPAGASQPRLECHGGPWDGRRIVSRGPVFPVTSTDTEGQVQPLRYMLGHYERRADGYHWRATGPSV